MEYAAGFVDGEAQVCLGRIPRRRSYEYCLRISIYNTNQPILTEIRKSWGGTLTRVASRNPRWKPCFALIWTNAAAARFLSQIEPHLRVKSRQAAVLNQFRKHVSTCRRTRDRFGRLLPLSRRELEIREAFYSRLKDINRKGVTIGQRRQQVSPRRRNGQSPSVEYLAGFIDAEGCLRLTKVLFAGWNPQYGARVQVSNTNRTVLEDLQHSFGGIITNHPRRALGWKDEYQLLWTGRKVEPLLRVAGPYLRIKQRQARIVLRFLRHRRETRQGRIGRAFAHFPKSVIEFREDLFLRIKELNSRGPSPSKVPARRASVHNHWRLPR